MCEPNFSCAFCNATFVRIDSMQSHLRQHQKLQPELEGEIFSLQQQLQQEQQSNQHQPTLRSLTKKPNEKIHTENIDYSSSDIIPQNLASKSKYNRASQQNTKFKRKNINRSLIQQPLDNTPILYKSANVDEATAPITLTSESLTSSPTNAEVVIPQESNHGPITFIVSPTKTGKSLSSPSNQLQQISPSNLHGISYLAVSPTNGTTERNITTLSVPVAATSMKNTGDGISLLPGQVSLRTIPYSQDLAQKGISIVKIKTLYNQLFLFLF